MSTSLVIVAIPEEVDRVWKVSSEKVPHLTLLYLGDIDQVQHVDQIVQFVEHAVTLSEHGPFYLDIDHRGTLGDAEADVVFFNKRSWNLKWIKQFRGQLLQNQAIRTAFDGTAQHLEAPQEWLPHLTLGYPETPAKPLPPENDYPLYSVCFDRIAVWTEEFDGPEFRLEWPDRELEGPLAVAYSDQQKAALAHYGGEGLDLEHHGVKGMKWGVTRGVTRRARNAVLVADLAKKAGPKIKRAGKKIGAGLAKIGASLADSHWQSSTYSDVKHEAVHNHVAHKLDNNIEKLQRSPKYRGKDLKADSNLRKTYYEDVAKVTNSAYKSGVKEVYGENYTGTKTAHYVTDARGPRIEVRDKKSGETVSESPLTSRAEIKRRREAEANGSTAGAGSGTSEFGHAATSDAPDLSIELKLDDNGQIGGVGFVEPTEASPTVHGAAFAEGLLHGAMSPGEQFVLEHYGIKGMRWGVRGESSSGGTGALRREPPKPVAPHAESKVPHGSKRKTKVDVDGGENHPATKDALKVAEAQAKLRKSGPKALTNDELREVATRVQLEQQALHATRHGSNKFVRETVTNQGKQAVNQIIRSKIDARIRRNK